MYPESLLIVDDNELLLQGIKRSFEKDFSHVAAASTGATALAYVSENFYNFIVLDINLPDISGISMIDTIRKSSPQSGIVLITSYADEQTRQTALGKGALAVFEKPLDLQALKNTFLKASL